ncbi:hypothetical protein [Granulicella sp. L60]|uniref:hypothetical protein n=1 Tax=Granulicella sp. L60 TaxID=1641866 RepID=UPI00131BB0CA|nr:hypothetical protein [Granulicella sp. L60]
MVSSHTKSLRCLPLLIAAVYCVQLNGQTSRQADKQADQQTKDPSVISIAPAPSARFPADWYPPDNDVTYSIAEPVDAPYTATFVTTVHILDPTNGQVKSYSTNTRQARDSAGRKRDETEMPRPDGHGATITAHEVTVNDSVSHCTFQWMEPWVAPGKPTATVSCLSRILHYGNQNMWAGIFTQPVETHEHNTVDHTEPLGKKNFGDVEAVGVLRTKTITNPQSGAVTKMVIELWYSFDMKEMIQMREAPGTRVNQSGQMPDYELTNIHRTEPDPALFYPPAGYEFRVEHH